MFYWLFTQGRLLLTPLIAPLGCSALTVPLLYLWLRGVGIQRRAVSSGSAPANYDSRARASRSSWWRRHQRTFSQIGALFWVFLLPSLVVTALYVNLLATFALRRASGAGGAGSSARRLNGWLNILVGAPPAVDATRLLILGLALLILLLFLNLSLWQGLRRGGWLAERVDRWRRPSSRRGSMGSAHFCTMREYRRYRREDPEGITLLGAFWGERRLRLDWGTGKFCLSAEDAARGVLTLGAPGSGKTQAVILPVIADRMWLKHSLIVVDPQGELTAHVHNFAKTTGHLVIVHDPTSTTGPRFNLATALDNIPAASAIARVLVPHSEGDNKFWSDAAADLLTACLLRFDNLGQIKAELSNMQALAKRLQALPDDASLAAGSFIASVQADGKIATNTIATLGTALTGWSSEQVRLNTAVSDFDANLIVEQPVVVVLTCPGAMRKVYAPYLGATLQKLMSDLDTIGERRGGPLPVPVGVIIDEFPTLGRLDSLVESVNLVRKRRISILVGAQTKGQFHLIYGDEATKALFTGLATQIVYGGCDYDTAKFYSDASGVATADADPDPERAHLRQRPLLTPDEIMNPQHGNCTIFSRFVEANFAMQMVATAELTRLYERLDWTERLALSSQQDAIVLERLVRISTRTPATIHPPTSERSTTDTGLGRLEAVPTHLQHSMETISALDVVPSRIASSSAAPGMSGMSGMSGNTKHNPPGSEIAVQVDVSARSDRSVNSPPPSKTMISAAERTGIVTGTGTATVPAGSGMPAPNQGLNLSTLNELKRRLDLLNKTAEGALNERATHLE